MRHQNWGWCCMEVYYESISYGMGGRVDWYHQDVQAAWLRVTPPQLIRSTMNECFRDKWQAEINDKRCPPPLLHKLRDCSLSMAKLGGVQDFGKVLLKQWISPSPIAPNRFHKNNLSPSPLGHISIYAMVVCRLHDTAGSLANGVFISRPTGNPDPLAKSRPTGKIKTHW